MQLIERPGRSSITLLLAFGLLLCFIGCSSTKEEVQQQDESTSFNAVEPAEIVNLTEGVAAMNGPIKQFKTAVEANQSDLAQELAAQMAGIWLAMENEVGRQYPEQHAKLERTLDELYRLVQAKTLDRARLVQLDYELYQDFRELGQLLEEHAS